MAKARGLLNHVKVETGKRERKCHGNRRKHAIPAGESHLAVYDPRGGRKNYCHVCAERILERASTEISKFSAAVLGE